MNKWSFKKRFAWCPCNYPASQRGKVLELRTAEIWSRTCVAPELLSGSASQNSLASDKEFTLFCKSRIWAIIWLTVVGFFCCCMDNSSTLACLAESFSSQQILLNSSISWQSFAWSFWKSLFLTSISPYNLILSLWAWSAHRFAWCSWNRWDSNSWLISRKAMSEFLFDSISRFNLSLSLKQFLLSFSRSRTAKSTFRSRNFWRFSLSFNECTTSVSRSLSLSTEMQSVCRNRFSVQFCSSFLEARTTLQMTCTLFPETRGTMMELCKLLFACCCWMLLNSTNLLDWGESRWRRLGTRNWGGCWRFWSACVPDPCRWRSWRVWAHNLCLGLSQPFGKTHSSERARLGLCADFLQRMWWTLRVLMTVQRARTKHVGTHEKEHSRRTSRNDMDVKHCEWRETHFTVSQCGVPKLEMCGSCAVVFEREKCACCAHLVKWFRVQNKLARSVTKWTQACDKRLARLISYFITRMTIVNIVMWETRHSTADWVCFKTQTLLATLRTQKSTSNGVLCIFESRTFVPVSWCARNKRQVSRSSIESEIISLDVGLRMDGLFALDLWDIVIEVLHSNKDKTQLKHTSHQEQLVRFLIPEPRPNMSQETEGWPIESSGSRTHQDTFFSHKSFSCSFFKTMKPWSNTNY